MYNLNTTSAETWNLTPTYSTVSYLYSDRAVQVPEVCTLKNFYSYTIESILTGCIPAWYGNFSASDHKVLQRVVRAAQYISGARLPPIQDLQYILGGVRGRPKKLSDSRHPRHRLFSLHGKRYRSTKSMSKRFLNSFYPQAIRLLNI